MCDMGDILRFRQWFANVSVTSNNSVCVCCMFVICYLQNQIASSALQPRFPKVNMLFYYVNTAEPTRVPCQ